MATLRLYLDTRNKGEDGMYPIKIGISRRGAHVYISLDLRVREDQWDASGGKRGDQWVQNHPNKGIYNRVLRDYLTKYDEAVLTLVHNGSLAGADARKLKEALHEWFHPSAPTRKDVLFRDIAERFNELHQGRTREIYVSTMNKVASYCNDGYDKLYLLDITADWLLHFVSYCTRLGNAKNSTGIHLRNIRAIYRYAMDCDSYYAQFYPFSKFRIEKEATPKRTLTIDQLVMLRDYPCERYQCVYRDFFMLSFYLIGINPTDLLELQREDVVNGSLVYKRRKTHKWYTIQIEPEALEILERYKGDNHLLSFLDNWQSKNFLHNCNTALKRIGHVERVGRGGRKVVTPILPELTMYWARFTWANIAHRIGVPKDVISMALGHSFGVRVTDTYIDYSSELVVEANKAVIKYVREYDKEKATDLVDGPGKGRNIIAFSC